MSVPVASAAVVCILALLLTAVLHRWGWRPFVDPSMDETYSRIDLDADDADAFARDLERLRALPQLPFDPEVLT